MSADNAKKLLLNHNHHQYTEFTLNDEEKLSLPAISPVPWIGATKRKDIYKKWASNTSDKHVRFITKNDRPHAFLWQTTSSQLQQGVRFGIIKPQSISGKVIAALGQYRIVAHERVAKGMISNTQTLKLTLLDLYQERFEALQKMESLVNKNNTVEQYKKTIDRYVENLTKISQRLDSQFAEVGLQEINKDAINQLRSDIIRDIKRANNYLHSLSKNKSLRANNRARGHESILEFVKQQMVYNLYEMQGINQDITYSSKRRFALTRGELNDFIEDARKEIDDYQADPRNVVTPQHHGIYSANPNDRVTYDFSTDHLSATKERQVLLAISFIEGWDKVEHHHAASFVSNATNSEPLSTISATRWQTHRNFTAFFKYIAYFSLNAIKSIFVETKPWEEETWQKENFFLIATQLRQSAKPNEPMWFKPVKLFKMLFFAIKDVFNGIRDFGASLVIKMPVHIINDWRSTKAFPTLAMALHVAEEEIAEIRTTEKLRLETILKQCGEEEKITTSAPVSQLAVLEYHLTPGEQNDILTSLVRGIDAFSSVFTHTIYAKDPVAGILFTTAYAIGGAAIFLPAFSASVFGSAYVNWFANFSYAMGSSKLGAAIAGGSTQAQLFATGWDMIMHGPSSLTAETITQIAQDPLTVAAYCGAAYGLGYFLANGIAGHPIPWLSETLKADLGSAPETGYPLIGAKIGISLHEALTSPVTDEFHPLKLTFNGTELDASPANLQVAHKKIIERFYIAQWLSRHAPHLPKLKSETLFAISRLIDSHFSKEEATSLNKILYPEKIPSIAYQLFSIPLTYIPAILRVATSLFLSTSAWLNENPYPWQPVKRASTALANKIGTDLNRLLICAANIVHLTFNLTASLFKMVAFTLNMGLSRITSLGNFHIGHRIHQGFAAMHVFFNQVGEFFYPARTTKSVVFAHPAQTIKEMQHSYKRLVKFFSPDARSATLDDNHHSNNPIITKVPRSSANIQPANDLYLAQSQSNVNRP